MWPIILGTVCAGVIAAGSVTAIAEPVRAAGDESMTFRTVGTGGNCGGCEWISATGLITPETPKAFASYIAKEYPQGYVPAVVLHSPGGDLLAGLQVGKLIRRRGINTAVGETIRDGEWYKRGPGACSSACVFMFMGGVERSIDEKSSRIGVHQFYDGSALDDINALQFSMRDTVVQQAIMGVLVAYVKSMRIDTDILFRASMVPPTDMQYLSPDEIATFNLDNMRDRATPWTIEPYKGGIVAQSSVTTGPRSPEYITISCHRGSAETFRIMYSSRVLPGVTAADIKSSVFDYEVKVDDVTLKQAQLDNNVLIRKSADGMLFVSYELPNTFINVLVAASRIQVVLNVPHVYSFFIGREFPIKGASPYINAAMKNCVNS